MEKIIQTIQNKSVWFCLDINKIAHILQNESDISNCLPISNWSNQCVISITFRFVNDMGSNYWHEEFQWNTESIGTLRNDCCKLKNPFCKTTVGLKLVSFLGLSKWN